MAPYRYAVYGLTLECNVPLQAPGLPAVETGPPDVVVDWAGVVSNGDPRRPGRGTIVEETGGWLAVSASPQQEEGWTRLRFGYGDHHVQFDVEPAGTRVVVTWTPEVPAVYVHTLLLSTVMGYLLFRLGRLALHAGVIAWRRRRLRRCGRAGRRKIHDRHRVDPAGLCRDQRRRGCPHQTGRRLGRLPRPDGIRLTPQAQAALRIPGRGRDAALAAFAATRRSGLRATRGQGSRLLRRGPGSRRRRGPAPFGGHLPAAATQRSAAEPRITALPATAAVPHVVAQLLTPAWLAPTVDAQRFETVADLVRLTPVRTVERPDRLAAVPQLCDALLDEMERLRG